MNIVVITKEPDKIRNEYLNNKSECEIRCFDNALGYKEYLQSSPIINVAIIDVDEFRSCVDDTLDIIRGVNLILLSNKNYYDRSLIQIKASAYLFYPISKNELEYELNNLRYPIVNPIKLRIQCFGNFSVFTTDGNVIKFSRSKAKELLAYLVYKKGTEVSKKELGAVLFEDQAYDEKQQSYLQQIFFALSKDLKAVGAEDVLVKNYNSTSINTALVDCDYFRFNSDDKMAKRLYTGEFMMQYEWAEYVIGYLDQNS